MSDIKLERYKVDTDIEVQACTSCLGSVFPFDNKCNLILRVKLKTPILFHQKIKHSVATMMVNHLLIRHLV